MILHKGKFLQVTYEEGNSIFCQYWLQSPTNTKELKEEVLKYIELYKKYRPKYALWLQENFKLDLTPETRQWINEYLKDPKDEFRNEKVALVVSKDILAHLSVMETYKASNITYKHFASEVEARAWLLDSYISNSSTNKKKTRIVFDGVDDDGNQIFKVKINSDNISSAIRYLNKLAERDEIIKQYQKAFNSLTDREKEILKLFCTKTRIKDIAEKLFISEHTARTHWKSIKRKLNINSNMEIIKTSKILFDTI